MLYQQGDVLLTKIESLPESLKEINGNILHQGDNHSHTISGKFKLFSNRNDIFLQTEGECTLDHCEHGVADKRFRTLPSGIYKKSIVMEYDHWLEESRKVID